MEVVIDQSIEGAERPGAGARAADRPAGDGLRRLLQQRAGEADDALPEGALRRSGGATAGLARRDAVPQFIEEEAIDFGVEAA